MLRKEWQRDKAAVYLCCSVSFWQWYIYKSMVLDTSPKCCRHATSLEWIICRQKGASTSVACFDRNPLLGTRELCEVQSQGQLGDEVTQGVTLSSDYRGTCQSLKERDVNGSFQSPLLEPPLINLDLGNCCSSERSPRWLETLYFCICFQTIPPGEVIFPEPGPYRL